MEPSADLKQRPDSAAHPRAAFGRHCDARQQLQQRALAGAIAADDADRLAAFDGERNIAQRPQILQFGRTPSRQQSMHRLTDARARRIFAQQIPLAERLGFNRVFGHQIRSTAKRSSRANTLRPANSMATDSPTHQTMATRLGGGDPATNDQRNPSSRPTNGFM